MKWDQIKSIYKGISQGTDAPLPQRLRCIQEIALSHIVPTIYPKGPRSWGHPQNISIIFMFTFIKF